MYCGTSVVIIFGRTVNVLFSLILLPVGGPILSRNRYSFKLAGYRNGKSAIDPAPPGTIFLFKHDF